MKSEHFDAAHRVAHGAAVLLHRSGVPSDDIADVMLTAGLAAWAAETGRHSAARELLRVWSEVRDGC
jgi:hypothetical protein